MQKVLIVTYYWPPAGGPGVQRWLKFVKYLPDYGITPIVFVPKGAHYPMRDATLSDEIPTGVQVIQHPIREPYRLAAFFSKKATAKISSGIIAPSKKQSFTERLLLWIRGNFYVPDARKNWVRPAVRRLEQVIQEENIATVITTGPPHSVHLIGLRLKEKYPVKWLADFRDPWTSIGYHKKLKLSKSAREKHKLLEQRVLQTADTVMVTSNTTKEEFQRLTTTPIHVITNGYDRERMDYPLDNAFTISHIGSLLTDRNPIALWEALSDLVVEHPEFSQKLKIQLIGVVGQHVMDNLEQFGLLSFVEVKGYLPHQDVFEYQSRSQLLLLLEIDAEETRGIIPGKLFEYFVAGRPILAIGPEHWEAGQMVEQHKSGNYITQQNKEVIKPLLLKRFQQFQQGELEVQSTQIAQYHRKELTRKLANILQWGSS